MQQALHILQHTFGYDEFRLNQAQIIENLLNGEDVLTLMPTGGGKSLCYQIPAMMRQGVGIVVSPLIALMKDQVDALLQSGVKAAYLNSSQQQSTQVEIEQQLLNQEIDLLYIAPERLLNPRMLGLLQKTTIALFAIDEAHCVSQWGHDFRKEYQQLTVLHDRFPEVPRIALTATADIATRQEILKQLNLHNAKQFINSFDRPNIKYSISDANNARENLWRFIKREHENDAGIVYCLSRKKVESTAEWLTKKGRVALAYHAGLDNETRMRHQQRFLQEEGIIIVATIAFGMGIDKPDVRFVAHLNLPKNIEAYYQETGRAGRDGLPANAWLAYGLQDVILLKQMMQQSDAEEIFKRVAVQKLDSLLALCESINCRRQTILAYFDEQQAEPCGNCDNCLQPPDSWDGTEAAQKALSNVYRSGQRFGVKYLVDILTGTDNERLKSNRHDQLSTFGIGNDLHASEWHNIYRQLIARGYLISDPDHGGLSLTEQARPLLRGEINLQLRHQRKVEKSVASSSKQKQSPLRSIDAELFEALRQLRHTISSELGVPPYVIFHDKTLIEMAKTRPLSLDKMQYISGVGESKLAKYGQQFLTVIEQHPLPEIFNNQLSDTINETLSLFNQGKNIQQIAQLRELTETTIYTHLSQAIESGLITAKDVLALNDADYKAIETAIDLYYDNEQQKLKPVFDALGEAHNYGVIKCVMAGR